MTTKILAIDDSKTMRLAIKITFAAEDADVTSVSKGSDAVARAKQMGADVVLVDASLADGEPSGYDVCRALKSDASTSHIPVMVLVSNQTGVDEAKLESAGGDEWLAKPFETQELIDKVAALKAQSTSSSATASRTATPTPAPTSSRSRSDDNRTKVGMPSPAEPAVAAAPAATKPEPQPAAKPAASMRPATTPAASRPAPAARPAARPAAQPTASGGAIPIAIPIPFTSASAPTPGMARRIAEAAGSSGIDPKVAEALASLSQEVVERIVWEVVPELAESMIREVQSRTG